MCNQGPEANDAVEMAHQAILRISHLERLNGLVKELKGKSLSELKGYREPDDDIVDVMRSVAILIGHSKPDEVMEWRPIKVMLGKTGKQSLKKRILSINLEDLDQNLILKAGKWLEKIKDSDHVAEISQAAATFYEWSKGLIQEATNYHKGKSDVSEELLRLRLDGNKAEEEDEAKNDDWKWL